MIYIYVIVYNDYFWRKIFNVMEIASSSVEYVHNF